MKYVAIPEAVLTSLLGMAQSHVEDIQTGLEDGHYEASNNADIGDKEKNLALAEEALASGDPVLAIKNLLQVLHPGAVGLIANHHGQQRLDEACAAINAGKQIPGVAE